MSVLLSLVAAKCLDTVKENKFMQNAQRLTINVCTSKYLNWIVYWVCGQHTLTCTGSTLEQQGVSDSESEMEKYNQQTESTRIWVDV